MKTRIIAGIIALVLGGGFAASCEGNCSIEADCREYTVDAQGMCVFKIPACGAPVTCGNSSCLDDDGCTQPASGSFTVACLGNQCVNACAVALHVGE